VPKSVPALMGLMLFVLAVLLPVVPKAQALGGLAGSVTDSMKVPLAGVKITVTTPRVERTAVTDADGRYGFPELPAGPYIVKAELAGFDNAVANNVVVETASTTTLSFVLRVGCVDQAQRVDKGFASAAQDATSVLQIRILTSGSGERCPVSGFCVCTEQVAAVIGTLKAPRSDVTRPTIRFIQEGAGRIAQNGRSGAESAYLPGQEYIAFLRWNPAINRFVRVAGPTYMFRLRDGRVEFPRTDAPGISDSMTVEEFGRAFDAFLKRLVGPGVAHSVAACSPSCRQVTTRPSR
jgi:hypothetical protein